MGWWFGRKSAPANVRPFVPAWLTNDSQEEGFACSVEGLSAYVKSAGQDVCYRSGTWEIGVIRGSSVVIGGVQVVGSRAAAVASPTGGSTVDTQARDALNQILAALRQHGLIDT